MKGGQRNFNQKAATIHQQKAHQQQQMGAQGQVTWKMHPELSQTKEQNRQITEFIPAKRPSPNLRERIKEFRP